MCRPSFGHFSALIVHKILRKSSNETSIHDCVTSPKTKRNSDVATVENRKSRQNYINCLGADKYSPLFARHTDLQTIQYYRRIDVASTRIQMCTCAKYVRKRLKVNYTLNSIGSSTKQKNDQKYNVTFVKFGKKDAAFIFCIISIYTCNIE